MRYLILLVMVILTVPFAAWAQTDTYQMDEVVVKGTDDFTAAERKTTVRNVVFDEDDLLATGAETLSDFLQDMGFAAVPGPTAFSDTSVTIRGYDNGHHWNESSSRIIFLINGRRSGVNNIRQLALNNVERIEIVRGPEMLKYSAGSPGGVVNIITKQGGPQPFGGSLELGYGSAGYVKGQLAINGAVENFDYSMAYMYNTVNDYKDGKGNKVTNTQIDSIHAFNGIVGYTFLNNHRIGAEYYYYEVDEAHKPQYWDPDSGVVKSPSIVDRQSYIMALTYDGSTSDKRFAWNASYAHSQDRYISITDKAIKNQFWMGNKIETDQVRGNIDYNGDLFDLSAGADYIKYKTYNSGSAKRSLPWYNWPNGYPLHLGHNTENMGVYALGTLKLFENKVNITGGLRYDYARITDKHTGDEPWWTGSKNPWYGPYTGANMPTKRTFNQVSPSIGVTYLPIDWLKLRANYFRGFRAPGGRQLFSSDATEGYGAPGYPLLKAEKSGNYEVGFDVAWDNLDFSFSYFYSKFKNHITIRGIAPFYDAGGNLISGKGPSAQNAAERIQVGIEIGGSANIAGLLGYKSFELRPYLNFTYMLKRDELFMRGYQGTGNFIGAGDWAVINGVPKISASYGVRFKQPEWGTFVNLNFYYVGETWSGNSPGAYNPATWKTYGKFTIANLAISQKLWSFNDYGELSLKINVNNIFDKAYNYSTNAADVLYQGRNFYAGLVYSF